MSLAIAPRLENRRIFHSRDAEETRVFLGGKEYRFDIAPRQARLLDARINGVYMPDLYVGYVQYGAASVALSPGLARGDYWLQLPLHGRLEAVVGRDHVPCDPSRAAILSPGRDRCCLRSEADSARIQVALTKEALARQLYALLGEPREAPVNFAPAIDLTNGHGRSVARFVWMAVADLEHADSVLLNPKIKSAFEQFIVTALLLSQPHNHSDALRRQNRPIAPRDVKRAIDFMEVHVASTLTLADIVVASGVPGRTLFKHFRDFKGVSPMQYLRNARYTRIRDELLRADADASVTEIALRWGVAHMGRFSVEYRRRFGESPSHTLGGRRSSNTHRA